MQPWVQMLAAACRWPAVAQRADAKEASRSQSSQELRTVLSCPVLSEQSAGFTARLQVDLSLGKCSPALLISWGKASV